MDHSIRFATTIHGLFITPTRINASPTKDYRHSYNDWYIAPMERYSIDPPEVKSNIVEIPAMDGGLDLSESLTGYPIYSNREGSMEFYVDDDKMIRNFNTGTGRVDTNVKPSYAVWYDIYRDICQFLNGRKLYMLMEDDPRWVYHGRFTVGPYESGDGRFSEIKISYVLDPYKILAWRSDGEYYFDALYLSSLPFEYGSQEGYETKRSLINTHQNIRINGENIEKRFSSGTMPTVPIIHCKLICETAEDLPSITINGRSHRVDESAEAETIQVDGVEYLVKNLDIFDRQIVFVSRLHPSFKSHVTSDDQNVLTITCNGWISLDYDIGVL